MFRWTGLWGGLAIGCVLAVGCNRPNKQVQGGTPKPPESSLKPKGGVPPRLVLPEKSYNFGTMDQETVGSHVFEIHNEGEGTLELRFVNTSCGCTSVKMGDLVWNAKKDEGGPPRNIVSIKPGGSIDFEMTWETELKSGDFRTVAQVETSDPNQGRIDLGIEGKILTYVELTQSQVRIEDARNNQVSSTTVHVFSRKLDDLEIIEVKSSNPLITAETTPVDEELLSTMEAKSANKVTIKIEPGLPIGPFNASVTLQTNYKARPEMTISVTGNVTGDVILTPSDRIDFGVITASEATTRGVFVKLRCESPVQVKIARVVLQRMPSGEPIEPVFLQVTLKKLETNKNFFQLMVEVPKGAPGGQFKGGIELETDHPTAKAIKIPVRGQIGKLR